METNKNNLNKVIESEIELAKLAKVSDFCNGMKKCVIVIKESANKYRVEFKFTKIENEVGFIEDGEEIVWTV